MSKLLAGASLLAAALPCIPRAETAPLAPVVVTAAPSSLDLAAVPATTQSVTAETLARTVNLRTPEDAVRYLPNLFVRQRHVGDTQSPMTTRTSGVGASARSVIYVDGMLISALIGNNNTSASPKWGLISPEAIARVDVLYGPFSAAFPGNSLGAVAAFTTRMPQALEARAEAQGAWQAFAKYGDRATYGTGRVAASLGDRLGAFAFRLSYNHLDAAAQPLGYATAAVPAAPSASGAATTGGHRGANRSGQPVLVLGSTGLERQLQDNASGRATLELTPRLTLAYAFGLFRNEDRAGVNSYLKNAAGAPVYAGSVNVGGRAYSLAPSVFSGGVYRLEELQLAQGLSLTSHGGGRFDFALSASAFDYLTSRQRTPSGALPGAFAGGAGSANALDGTGWRTLDGQETWRPLGAEGAHLVTFGAHYDAFKLDNPRYALADWTRDAEGPAQALNFGRTRTWALWAQDAWTLAPGLKATLGARWEDWRASDGVNLSAAPLLRAVQPAVSARGLSPKAVLSYEPDPAWTFKASVGAAQRFPTVSELYQTVTVGTLLQTPDPRLKPERALSSELSAERRWSSASLRLSLFDERISDALLSQTAVLPSGAAASFVQNVARTHATGAELVGQTSVPRIPGLQLSGWITYVDARIDRDPAFPAAEGKRLPQLPSWRGALVATWSPTPRLDVTLAGRYADRAFATLDNSDRYANTWQGFSGYFVADAKVRYRVTPQLSAEAGVDNLAGRSYVLFHPFPQRTVTVALKYAL